MFDRNYLFVIDNYFIRVTETESKIIIKKVIYSTICSYLVVELLFKIYLSMVLEYLVLYCTVRRGL